MESLIKLYLQECSPGTLLSQNQIFMLASQHDEIEQFLIKYGCDVDLFQQKLLEVIKTKENVSSPTLSQNSAYLPPAKLLSPVLKVLKISKESEMRYSGKPKVTFESYLFHTILYAAENDGDTDVVFCLQEAGFPIDAFMNEHERIYSDKKQSASSPAKSKSIVKELCLNLNDLAKSGKIDPVIGREDEILRTIEVLAKRKKNNVVLLGKAGVGKTAIAEGLALAIVQDKVPTALKGAEIFNLEIANMVAGTQYRGQFEEKMMQLLAEFKAMEESGKMPILFIDEIHTMVGSGNSNGLDFANIIKPALSRGQLRCIGATTENEWLQFINKDKALKRRFDQVTIKEPTKEETLEILKGAKKYYEEKHKVTYTPESLKRVVDLSVEFITDNALPDKALDLLDYAGSVYKLKGVTTITEVEAEKSLARMKNISLESIQVKKAEESQRVPIGPAIKSNLFGQDHAVDQVVKVIERSIAGLQSNDKPIGSFLFCGPTGTGKTELCKLLAKEMGSALFRIDMSEFQDAFTVSKLIGSPPGYVGHEQPSILEKVFTKNNGKVVILLDEIEKAHPAIQEIFLQVLDNGRLTCSSGEEILFKNSLIIMTSNAGSRDAAVRTVGFNSNANVNPKGNTKAIEAFFSPEFRNRLNGVIHFNSLTKDLMINVVKKTIKNLCENKLMPKGISLTVDASAEEWIANLSYDSKMGARPIERSVDDHITQALVDSILYGDLQTKKKVKVTVKENKLSFKYS
jgi:ATP-dependent Clp protease ATP-binding subunit ClpA